MIAICWLRSRAQVTAAACLIAVLAVITAVTGHDLARLYRAAQAGCAGPGHCPGLAAFASQDGSLRLWLGVLVAVVPAIIGMFWGAPLVASELEDGTFRLAWTQSVTRTRWLAVRLAAAGLASMSTAGLVSLLVTWWASPLDQAGLSRYATFDQRDIVPIGYAAFALVLGVTAGTVLRRTRPAMVFTLVAFIAARMAVTYWVRPRLLSPLALTRPADVVGYGSGGFLPFSVTGPRLQFQPPSLPNAWITSMSLAGKRGRGPSAAELARICPSLGQGSPGHHRLSHTRAPASAARALHECGARLSTMYHEAVSYQPASHYWPLQWYELAAFMAAALMLGGLALWQIRHIN